MTTKFNLEKYCKRLNEDKKDKHLDITEEIKPELKEAARKAVEKGLKIENILNLKIEFDEKCEFNNEAVSEIKTNIHLIQEPQDNKCIFINENVAWVIQNPEDDIVRYFSQNKKTYKYFYLDIIDIYMLVADKNYSNAVTDLLSSYKFRTNEEKRKMKNKQKYENNLDFIENYDSCIENYPKGYKRIKRYLDILIVFNKIGLKNIHGDINMIGDEAIFFASLRFLAKELEEYREDNIPIKNRSLGKIINLFCVLGFIEKVDLNIIPNKLKERSKQISKGNNFETINYYMIKEITSELLEEIEENSKLLSVNSINLGNISYKTIKLEIGKDMANKVYPNYSLNRKKVNIVENENMIDSNIFRENPPF